MQCQPIGTNKILDLFPRGCRLSAVVSSFQPQTHLSLKFFHFFINSLAFIQIVSAISLQGFSGICESVHWLLFLRLRLIKNWSEKVAGKAQEDSSALSRPVTIAVGCIDVKFKGRCTSHFCSGFRGVCTVLRLALRWEVGHWTEEQHKNKHRKFSLHPLTHLLHFNSHPWRCSHVWSLFPACVNVFVSHACSRCPHLPPFDRFLCRLHVLGVCTQPFHAQSV